MPQTGRRALVRRLLELDQQLLDPAQDHLGPVGDVRGLGVVAQDPAGEVGLGDRDARRPEVRDEDLAGVGAEREVARRPAPGARADVALDDQPPVQQLLHAAGDDRAAEAGPGDQVRA